MEHLNQIIKPVTIGFLAQQLKVKRDWLQHEAEAGNIPCLKAGDTYLFDYELVVRIIAERAKGGADAK